MRLLKGGTLIMKVLALYRGQGSHTSTFGTTQAQQIKGASDWSGRQTRSDRLKCFRDCLYNIYYAVVGLFSPCIISVK